ncbi:MAG: TIGR02281 family clan AA aspartic protease [Rubellimicrobium sp.]|nr:TIGR02281 family clan AA aspartic protease [Rubellimicrobium sp.]
MSGDQIAQALWLGLLLVALGGWFALQLRGHPGRTLQHLAVWALIFVGVAAGYGLWHDIRSDLAPVQTVLADGRIEIPRGRDGHFQAVAAVNGVPIRFVIDTGASDIVLSARDARKAGIDTGALVYLGQAQTANGTVATAPVVLDSLEIGPVTDRNLRAVVNGGEMEGSLLGMSWINRFAHVEIAGGRLILSR